jgi:hypothetical protein
MVSCTHTKHSHFADRYSDKVSVDIMAKLNWYDCDVLSVQQRPTNFENVTSNDIPRDSDKRSYTMLLIGADGVCRHTNSKAAARTSPTSVVSFVLCVVIQMTQLDSTPLMQL